MAIAILIYLNTKQNYFIPLEYFLIISFIAGVIVSQILFLDKLSKYRVRLILLEIFLLAINVSTAFLFLFPGPYGNDASYHIEFINSIITSGSTGTYYGQYATYPAYHILHVFIMLILKTSLMATHLIVSAIQVLFAIFGFLLVRKILNEKIALISMLLISFSPYLLVSKYVYFPSSFSVIFFMLILYLLFQSKRKTATMTLLTFMTFFSLLSTHPFSPVIVIATFLIIFIFSQFLNIEKISISGNSILLISSGTLCWWMIPTSDQHPEMNLFSTLVLSIRNAFETVDYTSVEQVTLAPLYNWSDVMLCELGFSLLILFAITGTLYSLREGYTKIILQETSTSHQEKVSIMAIIILSFIPIPYILALVYSQSFPDRWFPFIEVFLCIFTGVWIALFYAKLLRFRLKHFTAFLILCILIFFMATSPIANPNSQIYAKELSGRSALTQSEIAAAGFINWLHPQHIHANSKYVPSINRSLGDPRDFINPNDPNTYRSGLVVIRNYDLEKGFTIPLFGYKGKLLEIICPDEQFYRIIDNSNKFYENGEVRIYYNT